jgi:hypothetical protein
MTGWESLGGLVSTFYRPRVLSWGPNRLDIFVVGQNDNALYHKAWDGAQWQPSMTGWENLGGTLRSAPAVVSDERGRLDIYALGQDTGVYRKSWLNTAWAPGLTTWDSYGGQGWGEPVAVSWCPTRVDLFGPGLGNHLYHKAILAENPDPGWENLAGDLPNDFHTGPTKPTPPPSRPVIDSYNFTTRKLAAHNFLPSTSVWVRLSMVGSNVQGPEGNIVPDNRDVINIGPFTGGADGSINVVVNPPAVLPTLLLDDDGNFLTGVASGEALHFSAHDTRVDPNGVGNRLWSNILSVIAPGST